MPLVKVDADVEDVFQLHIDRCFEHWHPLLVEPTAAAPSTLPHQRRRVSVAG
jgi:hypothetical protein